MSSTPNHVLSQDEYDKAMNSAMALRLGDIGVTPATLDPDTDHEQRVIVLTVDSPSNSEEEIPVAVLIQGNVAFFERLTHPDQQVVLESAEEGVA